MPSEPTGPTYYGDIAPILEESCAVCHSEGEIGGFALTSYDDAKAWAPLMAMKVATREMPPWPPRGSSPAMMHDRSLSNDAIAAIMTWAENGAPEGDAAKRAPVGIPERVEIGTPELIGDIGVDYVPDTSLRDDYRCFAIDLGTTEDRIAVGYRITPGNRGSVHHVITSLFAGSDRAALAAIDAETPDRAGWPCVGGPVPQRSSVEVIGQLGAWVPGVSSVLVPAGTGTLIPAGAIAVMQMHYNLAGGTEPDRTKIEVELAPRDVGDSLERLTTVRMPKLRLDIPANTPDVIMEESHTARQWTLNRFYPDGNAYVLGVAGHMHTLGTQLVLERTRGGVITTLLDIPAWDFHWQGSYKLVEAIDILPTDTLTVRCVYDNTVEQRAKVGSTTPMADIHWGEGTGDEMCIGYLMVVDERP